LSKSWSDVLGEQMDADLDAEARQVAGYIRGIAEGGQEAEAGEEGAMNGAPTGDAEDEARAGTEQPPEIRRWLAEFERNVEAATYSLNEVARSAEGTVQAKLSVVCTLTMKRDKLALDCALSETAITLKAGGKQSFCQTEMPITAARRAAFHGHTSGQLRLMIDGVDEETAVEMAATAGDDVPAERFFGDGEIEGAPSPALPVNGEGELELAEAVA